MVSAKRIKNQQELIDLQDKAIQALQQANQALALALDILWKARQENGFTQPLFPTFVIPNSSPYTISAPSIATGPGPGWNGGGKGLNSGYLVSNGIPAANTGPFGVNTEVDPELSALLTKFIQSTTYNEQKKNKKG